MRTVQKGTNLPTMMGGATVLIVEGETPLVLGTWPTWGSCVPLESGPGAAQWGGRSGGNFLRIVLGAEEEACKFEKPRVGEWHPHGIS